jgi:hypothetical protein
VNRWLRWSSMIILVSSLLYGCGIEKEEAQSVKEVKTEGQSDTKLEEEEPAPFNLKELEGFWVNEEYSPVEVKITSKNEGMITYINGEEDIGYRFVVRDIKEGTVIVETTEMVPQLDVHESFKIDFSLHEGNLEIKDEQFETAVHYTKSSDTEVTNSFAYYELPADYEVAEDVKDHYNEEIMALSDEYVEVGLPKHHFSTYNNVYPYLLYKGEDSPELVREKLLEKVTEINKLTDKYKWVYVLGVEAYLADITNYATEEELQTNTLNMNMASLQQFNVYQITSYPLQRKKMVEEDILPDDLAAYVCHFGVDKESGHYTSYDDSIFCSKGKEY